MFEKSSNELAINKLYILYILSKMEIPLSNSQIINIFMENDILDYFSLQQYLHELKDANLVSSIEEEGHSLFSISPKGITALKYFENRIPSGTKDSLDVYVFENRENILRDREVKAEFKKIKDGEFDVKLQILDGKIPYINIDLKVPTNKTAKTICDNWKEDASNIYSSIIENLINHS